jgi:hypothetical protein
MNQGRETTDPVVPVMRDWSEDQRALKTRTHFATAKITRARLTENTLTTMHVGFRSRILASKRRSRQHLPQQPQRVVGTWSNSLRASWKRGASRGGQPASLRDSGRGTPKRDDE